MDLESGLDDEISGIWIQNNAVGEISFRGSAAADDKFVTGNVTVEPEEGDGGEQIDMDGEGTEDDPYVIENADHLQDVAIEPDAHFVLGSNVDASETAEWNGGDRYEPIGSFSGSLDGAGHTIEDLTIDRPILSEIGMISVLESGAEIHDVQFASVDVTGVESTGALAGVTRDAEIRNVSLTGSVTAEGQSGGLVGIHGGLIENADVDATVSLGSQNPGAVVAGDIKGGTVVGSTASGSISARSESGGIAGWNDGGTIENCHSDVTVDATDTGYSGGLVGIVIGGGTVSDSSANSEVAGGTGVGAFVGRIYGGTVERCTADGTVTGEDAVGGFVGQNDDIVRNCYSEATAEATVEQAGSFVGTILTDSSVTTSYAVGAVSGPEVVGGLAGENAGTLADSYWDTETTGQSDSVGAGEAGGEGLSTAQMTGGDAESNMAALDFADTWTRTDGYPQLAWE